MAKILNQLKTEIIEINGKILNIDDVAREILNDLKVKNKKDAKTLEKIGFGAASKILIMLGSTTVDDKIITTAAETALITAAASFGGGSLASYATTATLDPIFAGVFKAVNAWQLQEGYKLGEAAAKM